jgi:hypothetical protein
VGAVLIVSGQHQQERTDFDTLLQFLSTLFLSSMRSRSGSSMQPLGAACLLCATVTVK